jgi:phage regulator Rha-like protein
MNKSVIPSERIAQKIYLIRGQKVMLDSDLAEFYGVETKHLNRQVKRNINRFPDNFVFKLKYEEIDSIHNNGLAVEIMDSRCQKGTLKRGSNIKYLPYAFTEHGVLMLASVLKSNRAAQVSIAVVNAFIKMREYLARHKQIAEKLEKFEKKLQEHDKHLITIYEFINTMLQKPKTPPKQIGFRPK